MAIDNGFIEERLTACAAYGTSFEWSYNTSIQELKNKSEARLRLWSRPRLRATLVFSNLTEEEIARVNNAFHACCGRWIGFRVKNHLDYKVEKAYLGVAKGGEETLQLAKTYIFGNAERVIDIKKPVLNTVKLYADGEEILCSVNVTNGKIVFEAEEGQELRWSGEYDFPMRFDTDSIGWSINSRTGNEEAGTHSFVMGGDVDLVEIV